MFYFFFFFEQSESFFELGDSNDSNDSNEKKNCRKIAEKLYKILPHQTESLISFPERRGKHFFYHFTFELKESRLYKDTLNFFFVAYCAKTEAILLLMEILLANRN